MASVVLTDPEATENHYRSERRVHVGDVLHAPGGFPEAPVRQWVPTFPFPLRFLFAAHPDALTQVLAVVQRGIKTFIVQKAGLKVSSGARTGAVTLRQRFGSALNLNVHPHMLFLDGAYTFRGRGRRQAQNRFWPVRETENPHDQAVNRSVNRPKAAYCAAK